MSNTAWDIVTQYVINDTYDCMNPTKRHFLKSLNSIV